jgi:hypothetical protein
MAAHDLPYRVFTDHCTAQHDTAKHVTAEHDTAEHDTAEPESLWRMVAVIHVQRLTIEASASGRGALQA